MIGYDMPLPAKAHRPKKAHSRLDRPQLGDKVVVNQYGNPANRQDMAWRIWCREVTPLVKAMGDRNEERFGHR